jgi:DNA repair ATPase RecN
LESHAANGTATPDILHTLQDQFNGLGFVPRKDISAIRNRYHEAVEKFIQTISSLNEDEKSKLTLETQISELRNDPMADRKIFQKEQAIRKRISKVENDISLWKNNLEFFSRSSNAESVRTEFNEKIKEATEHLKQLKEQLKLLKTV